MCALAVLLWTCWQAAPAPGPALAVEELRLAATQGHVFSRRALPLTLRVLGGQGRKLDLRVQAYQQAHALAVPAAPAVEVASGAELGASAWHDFPFLLDCPAVERAVTWELCFLARTGAEEEWTSAGRARLELHPPDMLEPLRAHARRQGWFVGDPEGALAGFLNAAGIPFRDLDRPAGREAWARARHAASSARPPSASLARPIVLWVRARDERAGRPSSVLEEAARLLLFEETTCALALRLEPGKTRVTLERGRIARLADDPRAQMALVEAVELLHRDPSDGTEDPP
jgi:hypothetical protein